MRAFVAVTQAAIVMMLAGAAAVLYLWYDRRARRLSSERLASLIGKPADAENREEALNRTVRSFPPRYRLLAPALGFITAVAFWLLPLGNRPVRGLSIWSWPGEAWLFTAGFWRVGPTAVVGAAFARELCGCAACTLPPATCTAALKRCW